MRELKDYFCTPNQSEELIKLGCKYDVLAVTSGSTLMQVPIGYKPHPVEIKMFLRSQALDFFRDLGCDFQISSHLNKGYWFGVFKNKQGYVSQNYTPYPEAENALIDKLIELEKEARNEK